MPDKACFWSLLSVDGDLQYGGSLGYDDDIKSRYEYDNFVPYHKQLKVGDIVFLRNKERVQGVAVIESISSSEGAKKRRRCPECKGGKIAPRKIKRPEWRCSDCAREFDNPVVEEVPATLYKASFGDSYISVSGDLSSQELRRAVFKPSDQLSIEKLDPMAINLDSIGNSDEILRQIASGLQADYEIDRVVTRELVSGFGNRSGYVPETSLKRDRVLKAIAERRGQKKFRTDILIRFNRKCLVTDCNEFQVLEAAHIRPYVTENDNHPENGLLLRSDIHTLFDLDLLGFDPVTLTINMHPELRSGSYGELHGKGIHLANEQKPSIDALKLRWKLYLSRSEAVVK